jgi:tetratricopeptide (TPR) repeat protein
VLCIAWTASFTGCKFAGREGPVSRSLLTCRQLSQRGVVAMDRKDWNAAEANLSKAVEACPVDPEARRYYSEALWQRGNRQQAIAQLNEAVRLSGDDATLHIRLAERHLAMGQVAPARQDVEKAIDLDPKSAVAWALRGRILQQAGDTKQALADYHRSLSYQPDQREVLLEIAELYRQMGQPQRALANLQSLLDSYPAGEEPQNVLYLEGLSYAALRRWEDAAMSFASARDHGEPTPEILYRLGEAEFLAGHRTEAQQAAQQALALQPNHVPSRTLLDRIDVASLPQR